MALAHKKRILQFFTALLLFSGFNKKVKSGLRRWIIIPDTGLIRRVRFRHGNMNNAPKGGMSDAQDVDRHVIVPGFL